MYLQHLSPKIRTILTAPDVDLATISAKRVRKQLAATGESEDLLKQRKADIDALIAQVYESVSSGAGAGSGQHANGSGGKPRPGTDSAHAAASPQKRSTSQANDAVPHSSPTLLDLCARPQRIRHWQMDLQYLSPKIRTILTAPDVNLARISAKRVRKQLAATGESEDLLKQRKADIDALIAQVYESVSSGAGAG